MAARASIRISIRWPPDDASEPTDTLVLSVGGYYVDLRVLKSDQSIDWALAGRRIVVSEDPLKVEFSHIIDSQHVDQSTEVASDLGSFTKLPNGDDFETGEMAAPHLGGKVMPYEEVWREIKFDSDHTEAWVLESVDQTDTISADEGKSFCAKIGTFFLHIRQNKSLGFSAVRQEYDTVTSHWITKYRIGDVTGMLRMGDGKIISRNGTDNLRWKNDDLITFCDGADGPSQTYIVKAVN